MLDRVAGQLERYMDLLSARQKLVAANLANADTPGYKTKDVDFHFEFMSAMAEGTPVGARLRVSSCDGPDLMKATTPTAIRVATAPATPSMRCRPRCASTTGSSAGRTRPTWPRARTSPRA